MHALIERLVHRARQVWRTVWDRVGPTAWPQLWPIPQRRGPGEFVAGSHTLLSLTRAYKLYVPPGAQRGRPLVVMLHGCKQDPDDFAAGTGMNGLAREQGFFVLYPAQDADTNPSRCWNWFKHPHQGRDSGEAALIASAARAVIDTHGIDGSRVFIAGLSAGGAMAALVAAAHPELFAAVAVHSGLAPGAARSLPAALLAMRSGASSHEQFFAGAMEILLPPASGTAPAHSLPLRTIVFHGDQDEVVHPRNGEQVLAAALAAVASAAPAAEVSEAAAGRRFTRTVYRLPAGDVLAEHWLVHGAGHAWSGGLSAGSYTDAQGPDASREMLRFFFSPATRSLRAVH